VTHAQPGSSQQDALQPSPLIWFPSSHCSVPSMIPLPQVEPAPASVPESQFAPVHASDAESHIDLVAISASSADDEVGKPPASLPFG
jgi:hypothetical protein